jgi:23S rRNA (guanosine2251-2'-O)-methyltransferase
MTKIFEYNNPVFDPNIPRNVVDHLKWMETSDIKKQVSSLHKNISLLLVNIDYDINTGTIIRSANNFGVKEVILYGRKKFDRRASVGSEFYMNFRQIEWEEELDAELRRFDCVIGLENNLENTIMLPEFKWEKDKNYLVCVGQEGNGIPKEILDKCEFTLEIPSFGSVRSLNVGVSAAIVMYDYVSKATLDN